MYLSNQEMIYHPKWINIDCKSFHKVEWDLKRVSNLIQIINDWCWEQTWFDKVDTLHAIISKLEYYWWKNNNYIDKLITKRLNQITYDFSNIMRIMTGC
jgi:hypothetical protein